MNKLNDYRYLSMLCVVIIVCGALTNLGVVTKNSCRMPVYNLSIDTVTHFGYTNKSEVNLWMYSDIIHIGNSIWSYGDLLIFLGIGGYIFCLGKITGIIIKSRKMKGGKRKHGIWKKNK